MDMDYDVGQMVGAGTLTVFVMDWLKAAPWFKPLNQETTQLANRVVSFAVALFTEAGIKFVSSGSLHTGGTLTITFPALAVILNALVHASGQFGWQEMLHNAMGNHVMLNQLTPAPAGKAPAPAPAPAVAHADPPAQPPAGGVK